MYRKLRDRLAPRVEAAKNLTRRAAIFQIAGAAYAMGQADLEDSQNDNQVAEKELDIVQSKIVVDGSIETTDDISEWLQRELADLADGEFIIRIEKI